MDSETKILWPHEKITVRGETIVVSEMPWIKTFELLEMLSTRFSNFIMVKPDGTLSGKFTVEQLKEVILGSRDISKFLILESTGRDEPWLNGLRNTEFVEVLDATLKWNLHEAFLKKVRALGRYFADVMPGAKATGSVRSTTT